MDSEPPAMVLPENVWSEVAMVERVASAIPVARANRLELTRSMQARSPGRKNATLR